MRLLVGVLSLVVLTSGRLAAQDAKKIADGRKLYDRKDCAACHMIAGKGNKISPLDDVAGRLREADIRRWLTNTVEMEAALDRKPKVKMSAKKFNLSPNDVEALTAYLLTLRK